MPDYDLVLRLASAISVMRETHDHHGDRVAEFARELAQASGLPADQVELIRIGAHLHDIGKVLISRDVLNAPRKLSPQETSEMRQHTTLGWALVQQAGFHPTICEIVRHHHEHYDGTGYPDGLRAEEIPLPARIVAVCDAYEALTSPRTYRTAFTPSFAMTFMTTGRGRTFDARLVDLFENKVVST